MTVWDLVATRALVEKAQVGRLVAATTGVRGGDHWYICDEDASVAMISANDGVDEELRQPRAELFVHAVNALPVMVAETEALRAKVAAHEPTAPEPYRDSFSGCTDRNPDVCACGQDTGAQCDICEQDIEDGQMIQTLTRSTYPYLPSHHRDQEWEHYIWHVDCARKAADEADRASETQ
ncbi:hypothetical protein [Rhodococcus qingshengii]|uniref:hypothetical protein n=1 Tax=Rhodococcus qingshengii TaxID=334542 RepID=UPI001F40CEE7|nr:hypothetical protein [Rhodococcus qingshengii]